MQYITLRDSGSGAKRSTDFFPALRKIGSTVQDAVIEFRKGSNRRERYQETVKPKLPEKLTKVDKPSVDLLKSWSKLLKEDAKHFPNFGDQSYTSKHAFPSITVPLSWHEHMTREYRGQQRAYHDAILILAYICFCYKHDLMPSPFLRLRPGEIQEALDITEGGRKSALHYLDENGLIYRFVIKGLVPWYRREDATSGSYLYVVPRFLHIKKITRRTVKRFSLTRWGKPKDAERNSASERVKKGIEKSSHAEDEDEVF